MSAPSHTDRLRVLESTGLLDTQPEPGFDRLSRLAARLLKVPVALISLVDDERQFFKSAVGLQGPWAARRETPLSHSFCQYVARDRAPVLVEDAREHPVLRDSLALRDLDVVAYAGVPLMVEGQAIGAFCVTDSQPRRWSPEDVQLLGDLAASVVSEIELRLAIKRAREARALSEAIVDSMGDACMAIDPQRNFLIVNQAARRIFAAPVRDAHGRLVAAVAVYRDVSERKRALRQLRRSEQIHRAIIQHLPNGAVFVVDRDLRYVSAEGPILSEMMRRNELDGLVGRLAADVVSPGNRDIVLDRYRRALAGERSDYEIERDGRFFGVSIVPIHEGDQITHALISSYDVTDQRREAIAAREARDSLARERALFETTLAHIEDGVALIDNETRILLANRAFAAMLGLAPDRVIGLTRQGFVQQAAWMQERPEGFAEALAEQPENESREFTFVRPRRRILTRSWRPVPLAGGGGILVTWHDVTAERDLLREREQQLLVDALTGIPNRRAGEAAMRAEHQRMKRLGTPMCLAMFDVDHFKRVNDEHGHAVGDEVLRVVASTLAGAARLTDAVARWGGEEFLAVLNVPLEGALVFCERARALIAKLRCLPVERITVSGGVVLVAPGEMLSDAMARADRHLYDAKNAGRNCVLG